MALDIQQLEEDILAQYREDDGNIPWIIGFSGGKDSTMLLQLVWYALRQEIHGLRKRQVYVVCNNTLVENPKILKYTDHVLKLIEKAAAEQGLPLTVHTTVPSLEDSFWVNLLGKGYPAPNSSFRWCTERLKINPTTQFIKSTISKEGQAIILLGTRKDESSSRARSIEKNKGQIESSRLRSHNLSNAFVFAPITEVATEEVWQYLLQVPSPWGAINRNLVTIYNNATGGDCPLITDVSTPSCGNSRFGCWVCTVVKKDKSMQALIDNGEEWMEPMVEFRDLIADNRNNPDWREPVRRNNEPGPGPYKPEKRVLMLRKLLEAQREIRKQEPDMMLISYQELVAIQVTWHRDAIFDSVAEVYNSVYGTDLSESDFDINNFYEQEILKEVCSDEDAQLITELLAIQKSKFILANNHGMQAGIETYIEKYLKKQGV